jgi:excinuclease ABC subunit C
MKDDRGVVIYVGKAKSLRHRVRSYFQARGAASPKIAALVQRTASIETIVTGSEIEALLLEMNLIKEHRPRYNVALRDDKKFPYLKVTLNELYPQILQTRVVKEDGARYFGPYTNAKAMRRAERTLRGVFPVRSCRYTFPTKQNVRVCLDYHLKRCPGPCEGLIDPASYRDMIDGAMAFLRGRGGEVLDRLRGEMNTAAADQRYELAAFYRDQVLALEKVTERQRISAEDREDRDVLALARRGGDAVTRWPCSCACATAASWAVTRSTCASPSKTRTTRCSNRSCSGSTRTLRCCRRRSWFRRRSTKRERSPRGFARCGAAASRSTARSGARSWPWSSWPARTPRRS